MKLICKIKEKKELKNTDFFFSNLWQNQLLQTFGGKIMAQLGLYKVKISPGTLDTWGTIISRNVYHTVRFNFLWMGHISRIVCEIGKVRKWIVEV